VLEVKEVGLTAGEGNSVQNCSVDTEMSITMSTGLLAPVCIEIVVDSIAFIDICLVPMAELCGYELTSETDWIAVSAPKHDSAFEIRVLKYLPSDIS
jgi:hypothetical protein